MALDAETRDQLIDTVRRLRPRSQKTTPCPPTWSRK
jgi:hypothetical protein